MVESKINNSRWLGRTHRYAPILLWVAVIFLASSTGASMSRTSRFIRPVLEFFFPGASNETLYIYQVLIRKLAHLAEYSILAFLASRAFWTSIHKRFRNYWYLSAFAVVLLVASADEINQSLDPTRTGLFYDVLLDGFSGILMIGSLFVYKKYRSD